MISPGIIENFRKIISESNSVAGLTGAGVSTGSGIPDYRSQGGLWEKFTPVYYDEFLSSESKRIHYWERKLAVWPAMRDAVPGAGHKLFKELDEQGKLTGLITQNIDGLHEASGLDPKKIVNIHGNCMQITCLSCADLLPAADVFEGLDLDKGAPCCKKCGGLLKPNTISFGQNLDPASLIRAEEIASKCDCMIVAGSTLVVQPAAILPVIAKQSGAKIIILTLSKTPLDEQAVLLINANIEGFYSALMS